MSDASARPPARRARGWVNAVLGIVLVALVVVDGVILVRGPGAFPVDSKATRVAREYDAVTAAARQETIAFLTIDYADMDPLIAKVLAGATGRFKQEFTAAQVHLKAAARSARSRSTGTVKAVGIGDINATTATAFVAADSAVSNRQTKGRSQPRYYRLQLELSLVHGKWLTSGLTFVDGS